MHNHLTCAQKQPLLSTACGQNCNLYEHSRHV